MHSVIDDQQCPLAIDEALLLTVLLLTPGRLIKAELLDENGQE
jgi:hypothetical protein